MKPHVPFHESVTVGGSLRNNLIVKESFYMQFRKLILFLSLIGLLLSSSAFGGDFEYTTSGSPATATITGYTGCPNAGAIVIPSAINNMPVVGIGGGAFVNCTGLTSVTIPNSVTSIGPEAFLNCSGLHSVTIPNSVTSIGYSAFYYCTGLTSVFIPASVASIGSYAFRYDSGLTSIVVDASNTAYTSTDGVLYTKDRTVLIYYPGGKSGGFTIPNSVTSIGDYAFYDCTGLTSVTIPKSVTSIGEYAFAGCTLLASAFYLGNAPSMGGGVFQYCASNFTVCYTAGSTGFTTPTWDNYPATMCVEATTSTTSAHVTTSKSSSTTTSAKITSTSTTTSTHVTTSTSSSTTTSVKKICPGILVSGDEPAKAILLREYRDKVLMNTPQGRVYVVLFYKHSEELSSILLRNSDLLLESKQLLTALQPQIRMATAGNRMLLSRGMIDRIGGLLDIIDKEASPALQESLDRLKRDLIQGNF